jgi:ribosomal-protein-alanine N-acetyltransferase
LNNFEDLSKLHGACFPGKAWSANEFADLQKSGCEIIFSKNSFIVWRAAAAEAEIISIGVHPSARKAGLARALLAVMENELRKKNVEKIFLEVAADNLPAIKLYESAGFAKIGTRPKYYNGIDATVMGKNVTRDA